MKTDLISPKMHGLNDYVLSAILLAAPRLLNLDKQSQQLYAGNALNLLGYNAFSDHPLAIKRMMSAADHYKMDMASLTGLALGVLSKRIRNNKKALIFHLSILALSTFNVLLSDYRHKSVVD